MSRPERTEYVDYYHLYVSKVPEGDLLETLAGQRAEVVSLLGSIPEKRGDFRYAPGKWTAKELLGHLNDTERVLGFRGLAFARGDETPLPGFDQDLYVAGGDFGTRTIADLAAEFESMRTSHLVLFQSFDEGTWMRRGTASGYEFTVRAIAHILAGHVIHHLGVLRERYL